MIWLLHRLGFHGRRNMIGILVDCEFWTECRVCHVSRVLSDDELGEVPAEVLATFPVRAP